MAAIKRDPLPVSGSLTDTDVQALGSVEVMVWAEHEWVDAAERRRGRVANVVLIGLTLVGGAIYVSGLFTMFSGVGLMLVAAGLLVLSVTIVVAMTVNPYRRVASEVAPTTVFHISPAAWTSGEAVTLEVARCRKKQAITERWWARRARLVYFFPQCPTFRHARGQTLTGHRRVDFYLYELELQHPIDALYGRGAALATPDDVTALVRARQDLGSSWKKDRKAG